METGKHRTICFICEEPQEDKEGGREVDGEHSLISSMVVATLIDTIVFTDQPADKLNYSP